jgi:hypothetical protein
MKMEMHHATKFYPQSACVYYNMKWGLFGLTSILQESRFIEKLVKNDRQVEGLPDNCNRVMVWNFNLEPPLLNYPTGWSLYKDLEVNMPVT